MQCVILSMLLKVEGVQEGYFGTRTFMVSANLSIFPVLNEFALV